jgi:hypothetical protein
MSLTHNECKTRVEMVETENETIVYMHTPGHVPGSQCIKIYYINDVNQDVIHIGSFKTLTGGDSRWVNLKNIQKD